MPIMDLHTLVDCNCKAKVYSDGSGVDIEYCNVHRFAPEFLEVLQLLVAVDNCNYDRDTMRSEGYFDRARDVLAKVQQ